MNVIVLVSDTLRARNLSCYGYDKLTSPHLDAIAEKGIRFNNAFSLINSTDSAFTTLFTGMHPLIHGLLNQGQHITSDEKSYISNVTFLAEILNENDYMTIGLDWLGRWHKRGYTYYAGRYNAEGQPKSKTESNPPQPQINSSEVHLLQKLKHKLSEIRLIPGKGDWYYHLPPSIRDSLRKWSIRYNMALGADFSRKRKPMLSDSAGLTDLAIQYIQKHKQNKFFLFVHYWDNHIPYTAPASLVKDYLKTYDYPEQSVRSLKNKLGPTKASLLIDKTTRGKTPKTTGQITAHYDASIRYLDSNIARLYQTLSDEKILDDTLFIFTADHGESLGEHNIYFDHHGLYDPQIHIPMIMHHPSLPAGNVYDQFVQSCDIVPTVLDIAGISYQASDFYGRSLLDLVHRQKWDRSFVYARENAGQTKQMIRDHQFKYIQALDDEKCRYCDKYHCQGDEFYDLKSDPSEQKNIIDDPQARDYRQKLEKYVGSMKQPEKGEHIEYSDEAIINERFKALGYI